MNAVKTILPDQVYILLEFSILHFALLTIQPGQTRLDI